MNNSQLRQPLNGVNNNPSNSISGIDFSLGGQKPNSDNNFQNTPKPVSGAINGNLNGTPTLPKIPAQAQVNNVANQIIKNTQNTQNVQNNQNNNPESNLPNQTNWSLFIIYLLTCLLSLAGFLSSMITMILAGDVADISQFFKFSPQLQSDLNFIIIYNPFSGLVFFISIYLMYLSYKYYGKNINYSQMATLFFSVIAFVFGTVNYVQIGSTLTSCSTSDKACQFLNAFKAYQQMVIPVSLIPMLFLVGSQYILYRLKTAPPPPNPPQINTQQQQQQLELAQKNNEIKNTQKFVQQNMDGLNKNPLGQGFNDRQNGLNGQCYDQTNGLNGALIDKTNGLNGKTNELTFKPQVNLQTDPKMTGDIRLNSRGSQISDNGNPLQLSQNLANSAAGFLNPNQKSKDQLTINGLQQAQLGFGGNNLGIQMNQQLNSAQFQLDDKEVSTPKEQNFNIASGFNQNGLGSIVSMYKQSSTPTPNLGSSSNQKLNSYNPFENSPDIHNMKTTTSQFTNTPMKSPKKGLSPIDRALSNNQKVGNENINDIVTNNEYNPYGNIESGEIQLGKHPYILGAKDPYVGQILDQVQVMVNNQVKSLLLDLKRQNKV
ncbi:transmembrane protein, putative (macronuclear) [Tetrahymena thermophila SB210]|uniref:Transmembrane protein, putative n=1 Tax=Tetrahymena thermophila (strain SB210) TaxID=312017 RepID=I7LW16_TETTS|nr:transmembrane protein, putative [Tetrahymena thermophila SB210]EAS00579.1 transmembrane protein, putative [Tetrahymena thermophila SB210]|eukprot:XP_001020824.1 transmembrane protein, putative [Tetrahymena thermophila SB210]